MSGNDVISSLKRLMSTFAHVWVIQSYAALPHINYIPWDPHIGLVLVFAPRWAVQTEQLFYWLRLMAWPEFNLHYQMDLMWWETEEGIPVCSSSLVGPNITQKDELFISLTGKIICFLFFFSLGLATFIFSWEILFFKAYDADAHHAAVRCPSRGMDQYSL